MITKGDLPVGYISSRFHLLELGVYISLDDDTCINFYGQTYHGGTPPICPTGVRLYKYALRASIICYPNGRMLDGGSLHALASMPNGHLFALRPEMINVL